MGNDIGQPYLRRNFIVFFRFHYADFRFSRLRFRYSLRRRRLVRRGFLLKGGEYDYGRGERAVIDDFRKGKLGRITFDSVGDAHSAGLI